MSPSPRPSPRLGDRDLRRRLAVALASAHDGPDSPPAPSVEALHAAIERLRAQLAAADPASEQDHAAALAHADELARIAALADARRASLQRIRTTIARLRIMTLPAAMLTAAPRELGAAAEFARVVLSTVQDGELRAEAVWVRDGDAVAQELLSALRANPPRLGRSVVETEVVRRRRATVVTDAATDGSVHGPTSETMRWRAYSAAPVVVRDQTIAVLQADRGPRQELAEHDGELLWEFATGLAQAWEIASLRRTLHHEREQMRRFLAWVDARSGALSDAAIEFVPRALGEQGSSLRQPRLPPMPSAAEDPFGGLLTRRELEVLRLVAEGRTNDEIATALVISVGTVKFHVSSILRKLRVGNRAQAVARYLRVVRARRARPA
ncbi:helix-turn-helix transcriptional regulator [Conexibacter woesei]|uniref:Transcriptional regulator, LuxR family n=1 Tax=Conexibacter woesei (strain DSM 14684 / CCUG 47730 / CIP 108061 / JCM 11494 / NBRC 100937 / ID131577) TaxID=469383 RepID=D3F6X6_CONWI|nr:response regulator transcription factor [Conexibacter woesei]ADB52774.1 transcriptional regulator, LuxR family [Conexibacter woesei DSM 14684]